MKNPDLLPSVPAAACEPSDVPLRPLVVSGALFALLVLLGLGVSRGIFVLLLGVKSPGTALDHPLAEPREVRPPKTSLQEQRRVEEERLSTYRWIDRTKGIVAIPIERAMEQIANEGLPVLEKREKREER